MFRSRWKRQILNCASKLRRSAYIPVRRFVVLGDRQLALLCGGAAHAFWRDWLTSGWLSGSQARGGYEAVHCQSRHTPVQVRWKIRSDAKLTKFGGTSSLSKCLYRDSGGNQGQGLEAYLIPDCRFMRGYRIAFERAGAQVIINGESSVRVASQIDWEHAGYQC